MPVSAFDLGHSSEPGERAGHVGNAIGAMNADNAHIRPNAILGISDPERVPECIVPVVGRVNGLVGGHVGARFVVVDAGLSLLGQLVDKVGAGLGLDRDDTAQNGYDEKGLFHGLFWSAVVLGVLLVLGVFLGL